MVTEPLAVSTQLEDIRRKWEADLPPRVVPVVREHHRNLVEMANALSAAGHRPEDIRLYVRALVASYEQKLLQAIEAEKES